MCLIIIGPPSAPISPKIIPRSPVLVDLSWIATSGSLCVSYYVINLTNITEGTVSYTYKTTSNSTTLQVTNLIQGADYSFTVSGVDNINRTGEESVPSELLTFDGMLPYCISHGHFLSL